MSDSLGPAIKSPAGGDVTSGLPQLISSFIRLATIVGGIALLINLIIAGFGFLTASGDPKKVTDAWNKIWQSLVGLIIIVGAIALIRVVETILGFDILKFSISGIGE